MQIYEALVKDHRKLQTLLDRLVELTPETAEERGELLAQIRDELVPHSRAEEAVFYNSMREIDATKAMAWHGYEEHVMAETLLRTLQAATGIDAAFTAGAKKLRSALNHHIEEEENEMIPAARALFTSEEAEAMTEVFEKLKPQVRDESFMQSTLDMVANMLPARLAAPLRSYTLNPK